MANKYDAYTKATKVVDTCETMEQILNAGKYMSLLFDRYEFPTETQILLRVAFHKAYLKIQKKDIELKKKQQ